MAEDFSKIFAQGATSKQSWTDSNYNTGWGYLGQEPPPYELFDFLFNRLDKKDKELHDKFTTFNSTWLGYIPVKQINDTTIQIMKGNGSTENITINNVSHASSASTAITVSSTDKSTNIANTSWVYSRIAESIKMLGDKTITNVTGSNDTLTVTKGDNSTTTVKINNVKHASNADEATKANYLVTNENGRIYHDLSKVSAGADINIHVNWSAKDTTRKILKYIFHDAKGTGSYADLQAKTVYANLSGNADTSNRLVSERASSGRPTSANFATSADASIRYFLSTDSMQYSKPMANGAIVQFGWDASNNYDSQLFIPNDSRGRLQWRPQNGSSTWATSAQWKSLAWQDDLNNYLPLTGGTITGGMTFNGTVTTKSGIIVPTRNRGDNTTYAASTAFVQDAVNNIVNIMYPVGIIVEFAENVDPNAIWVGTTWERMSSGRVLVSAGTSDSGTTYTVGVTGGEESHQLTADEMPTHNHGTNTSSSGGHTHTGTTSTNGNHTHTLHKGNSGSGGAYFSQGQVYGSNAGTVTPPDAAGNHNHTFTTSSNGTHTHIIDSDGGSQPHNNMQPYEVVNRWKRTA